MLNAIDSIILSLIESFLYNRYKKVGHSSQSLKRQNVNADVPQGSVLEPLSYFIYVNDLLWGLYFNAQLFADDNSFSVLRDVCAHLQHQIMI